MAPIVPPQPVDSATVSHLAQSLQAGGRCAFYKALGIRTTDLDDELATASNEPRQQQLQVLFGELRSDNVGYEGKAGGDDATLATSTELQTLVQAALADHDTIMSASFRFHEAAATATPEDYRALLDVDPDSEPEALAEPLKSLFDAVQSCPFCRWSARLTWLREVPRKERTPLEELERLLIEPALVWRELELAWTRESATVYAAAATATANTPAILCFDGRTGERIRPERVDEPKWRGDGEGNPGPGAHTSSGGSATGRVHLSLFGLPARYSHFRLLLLGSSHLQVLLTGDGASPTGGAATELALPSLDEIERHAPDVLARLAATDHLPEVVVPQFPGRLTPYGEHSTLTWQSPPISPVRLRPDDIILCSLY